MYYPKSIFKCHDFTECNVLYRIRKKKNLMDNHRDEKLSAHKDIYSAQNEKS